MRIEQARFVKASPEQVFQARTDYEAWPRFSASTQVRVAERAGDVVYLGTKLRVMGRETKRREKVTLTPPQLIRVEGKTVGATNITIWKFEPAPGGTQVTGTGEAKFLIHDHDAKYGGGSDLVFRAAGIAVIRTPIAAPRANSHMERQIGSTRRECLDWLLIFNRRQLERVLIEWLEHYNNARPHRGLDLRTPIARSDPVRTSGSVTCHKQLGGLLREYSRATVPAAA